MTFKKRTILFILTIFVSLTLILGCAPRILIASHLLPNVSSKMEKPEYWIKKVQNPGHPLLTSEEIQKMNGESFKRQDLYLCKVKELKEEWTRGEILNLLKEDWEGFGQMDEIRYGRNGSPHRESFWKKIKNNLNQEALKEKNQIQFGLIIKLTDIRVFPTQGISIGSPGDVDFDRFQHSSISPGSLIGIYHFSKDKKWAYAQTGFIRGWIRTSDLAIEKNKGDAIHYDSTSERLLITGNSSNVFNDASLKEKVFSAQMGASFPILRLPDKMNPRYLVRIPARQPDDGGLTFQKGYIARNDDVHLGFLSYTQEKVARQAFKMLCQPYGWGDIFGARDCSRFIMDLFSTFGILMPRNSKLQAQIGILLGQVEGKTLKEKKQILDQAVPLTTILRLPGHNMLYLGKVNGRYYVIHNIWGIEKSGKFGPVLEKIGKVVVSDLSLGESGPNGSLLHRITDIRFIGLGKPNSP